MNDEEILSAIDKVGREMVNLKVEVARLENALNHSILNLFQALNELLHTDTEDNDWK